jgi:hypothetical protein
MKIAFFSESTADEEALKVLVAAILEDEIEETDLPNRLQFRSSSHLTKNLPAVINAVHYNSNAEALIVVSDSDDTIVHVELHDETSDMRCRFCELRELVGKHLAKIRELPGKGKLKVAIGVPVPAIEAWYLCGLDPQANEITWIRKQNGEKMKYDRKELKKQLYETDHPSITLETKRAIESARRLVTDLGQLEQFFPHGFGTFANKIRSWRA